MKRANCYLLVLIFSAFLLVTCQDINLPAEMDEFQTNTLQSEMTWSQRVSEARNIALNLETGLTRWDSPWWDMSHETLRDSIVASNGHVIIGFKNPNELGGVDLKGKVFTSPANIEGGKNFLNGLNTKKIEEIEKIPAVSAILNSSTSELVEKIRCHPLIDYIEPNSHVRFLGAFALAEMEYSFLNQTIPWNVSRIQAPDVWNRTTGSGVIVHIIDTGVTNVDDLDPATRYSNGGEFDDFHPGDGHGTLVAGITSALDNNFEQVGIAFDADLWSGKIPEDNHERTAFIANAIGWGRSNDTFVINLSFVISAHTSITDQINGAYNEDGLLIVAASGHTDISSNVIYPANLSNVIAVASVDMNNTQSSFSPSGSQIELSAPGEFIISTSRLGGLSNYISGTSFAAPHVSGAAALLKSYNPSWSNVQIRNLLNQYALPLGSSNNYGSGLVQVLEIIRITVDISGPVVHSGSGTYHWNSNV
ncbi:hypothetical protein BH23BAC3_BH23BAC3_34130 [soil metagenome]